LTTWGGSIINKISTINQGGLVKRIKKCIYHSVFLLLLIVLVLYTGTGCGNPAGWHIADTLVVYFEFTDDNVEYYNMPDDFPDNIEIMLPNQNYNDTLYYVLDAKICGIDNSIYAIDEDSTKWVTINDSFSDMNMKIMEEGNSIISYPGIGEMEFIDTLKIVRLSDSNGISAVESVDSAFSFKVRVYNKRAKQYEEYQKDFDMSFKKLMKIEITYTENFYDFLGGDFDIDDIMGEFKYLMNISNLYIEYPRLKIIFTEPLYADSIDYSMLGYSSNNNISASNFKIYYDITNQYSIHLILHYNAGMGGVAGATVPSNGNFRYHNGGAFYNDPIFVNDSYLYEIIKWGDPLYWEDSIGGIFKEEEFMNDYKKVLGMIVAHEIGHNTGYLDDIYNDWHNIMHLETNWYWQRKMYRYLDRNFDKTQKNSIMRYSQFYFKRFPGRSK
jgi:hypothetical protein